MSTEAKIKITFEDKPTFVFGDRVAVQIPVSDLCGECFIVFAKGIVLSEDAKGNYLVALSPVNMNGYTGVYRIFHRANLQKVDA